VNDAVGNIVDDTFHGYSFDADGNLISVDSGATATYYYDSLNQRVRVAPTRGTYEFVWDIFGRRVSNWAAASRGFVESNAYTDSSPVALRIVGQTQFEHQNWLGTERVRTTYNGGVAISIASLPWADDHTPSGDNGDQHDFALMDRDLEDSSEHAQYRQYSTNLGRFMSPDPLGGHLENPQSLNKYVYGLNNPLTNTDPTGLDSYLQCQTASSTCASQTVGYDSNGNAQNALVQGVTNADKSFTATLIGNQNADGTGPLVDKTTGTGTYSASVNGSVQFSNNGGQTSSAGVFVNGTPQTTFQDAGFANGGALSGFNFTLTNSKMEANQTEAGYFSFSGTPAQAGAALQRAGFNHVPGTEEGSEYRSSGSFLTGSNSGHFIVNPNLLLDPGSTLPAAGGDMHFGEHNVYGGIGGLGAILHCTSDGAGYCQ
jgi:RHS repeat-associated protein